MLISSLIYEIETHNIYKKVALFHIYLMIQGITACYKNRHRDSTLKTKSQNFHIKFLNSDLSVSNALNVTKFLGDALCSPLEGTASQNFDLGPANFVILCRKIVKECSLTIFSRFTS